jgi:hypothetical protein
MDFVNLRVFIFSVLVAVLGASCATEQPRDTPEWIGARIFRLSQEAGFQSETLELKEGRFRYWFSSDAIAPNAPKYPIEGSYECKGDQLILSSGKTYTIRSLKETNSLWRPTAVADWDNHQIIDVYGILLQVERIESGKPALEPLFTREQWAHSEQQVRQLERKQ